MNNQPRNAQLVYKIQLASSVRALEENYVKFAANEKMKLN